MKDPLFFIAILPDASIQKEVTAFKQYCAKHFNASHSLTSPPHITLIPPFPWSMGNLQKLGDALEDFAARQQPFPISLENFGAFPPRVIFVEIKPNQQLEALQASLAKHLEITIGLKKEDDRPFNPHLTIAHRDLQRRIFPDAWAHFSTEEYQRTFQADHLTLLRHTQRKWEIEEEFFLGMRYEV